MFQPGAVAAMLSLIGGTIVGQQDAGLSGIVPEGASVEQVATGFMFTEGPTWGPDGALYFSDIPADTIFRVTPEGEVSEFLKPSGKSNGNMLDDEGAIVSCRHWARNVARVTLDGEVTILAEAYDDKPLNSPNDCIVAADGALYFTDPHYGLEGREMEQDGEHVYRLAADGGLTRVVDDMTRPNGIFISPDGKTLYVADSTEEKIRAYTLAEDGSATDGRDLIDMRTEADGVPDGMTMDASGNVYCTGGGGVWVVAPDGAHLGTIPVPEVPANCTFGGADNDVLYITARSSVYRIQLSVKGLR